MVQRATGRVLELRSTRKTSSGSSYGFRPKRGQHDALDAVSRRNHQPGQVNFILDADMASRFSTRSARNWLIRFVEHRIGDKRIIRLIRKWLKAGVLEDGVVTVSDIGTGQGSVISPLLANIYLHYVSRPLGRPLATARGQGRYDHRAVCRRLCRRLRARGRRSALLGRTARNG